MFIKNVLFAILIVNFIACNFAPGSFSYAEKYEIAVNESDLIRAIQDFKKENPKFIVPTRTQLIDGRINEQGQNYWFHVFFYIQDENKIIKCWTRPIDKEKTTFAFVAINQGIELGNWKMINKDFDRLENIEEKKKFEKLFLDNIKSRCKIK